MADLSFQDQVQQAFIHNDADAAFDLVTAINAVLDQIRDPNDPDFQRLETARQQMLSLSLRFLSDKSIEDLFERSTSTIVSVPETVDIIDNIKGRLIQEYFIDDRNALRDKWRNAMLRCTERIGNKPIRLGNEDVVPTVENWLKLYVSEIGTAQASSVKVARFFAQNPSFQALNSSEKNLLKRLFSLFEFFKVRSDETAGFENTLIVSDENGRDVLVSGGNVKEVIDDEMLAELKARYARKELSMTELAQLSQSHPNDFKLPETGQYQPKGVALGTLQPQDLSERAQKFFADQRTKFAHRVPASGVPLPNRTAALVAMLHKAMSRGQEADMVLAKEILQYVFSDRERLVNFMRHQSVINLLQTELPKSIGEKNKEVLRQSPISPMAMQALLQIVFLQRFKLSPDESAWQSFETAQRLPAELAELKTVVTYDPGQEKLVWRYG